MNWKPTAVFAALLAVLIVAYFLYDPQVSSVPPEKEVLFDLQAERITKVEIARKGEEPYAVERVTETQTPSWKIRPSDRTADADAVQKMLWGLDRFVKAGRIERTRPEVAPEITGLREPRATVTFHAAGGRMERVRFGKQPPTNANAVFYEWDGDPASIYLVEMGTFEAYDRSPSQVRTRQLVSFDAFRLVRVDLKRKFTVGRPGEPSRTEYEESAFEKLDRPEEKGWFMTAPWKERVDPLKVQRLAADLLGIVVEEFQPAASKEQGFDEPEAVVSLTLHGHQKPIVVSFGGLADLQRKRWVQIEGTNESALLEARRFDSLPSRRNHFRADAIFGFTKDFVRRFTVELADGRRAVLHRKETRKEGEPVPDVKWELLEPKGLRVDAGMAEAFVGNLLIQRIKEFVGQLEFKLARLDPAEIVVTAETTDDKRHRFHFSGTKVTGYLRKEGIDEVFEVEPAMVEYLKRLELNFLQPEILNVPRETIREFAFQVKGGGLSVPIDYKVRWNAAKKDWEFADRVNQGKVPNKAAMENLLNQLSYISAVSFVGRGPEVVAAHQLGELTAPSTLTLFHTHEGHPIEGVTIFIGINQGEPGSPRYVAVQKGTDIVFQINGLFVENLKRLPSQE